MAAAQTGTGKTAGFTLPILELFAKKERVGEHHVRALVLAPTRELAAQVAESIETYGKHLDLRLAVVFGGVKINPQIAKLRRGVDILVATPGRLLDLYNQKAMRLDQLEILVLDEADRMLDMGFIHDIQKVMSFLPKKRQNLMFSATFSNEIRTLAKGLMRNAVEISATPANTTVNAIEQCVYTVDKKQKMALLSHLIWEGRWEQVLIFTRTKHGANRLAEQLIVDGIDAVAIHGNKSQGARTKALANFKAGKVRALVATDIAARGLDIELLPHVVNFDLPQVTEDYVHRIGRTGRAGATGEAISLVSADEVNQLADIERLIKQKLPRKTVDKFEPQHVVPETRTARTEKARSNPRNRSSNSSDRRRSDSRKTAPFGSRDARGEPRRDTRDGRRSDTRTESRFNTRSEPRKDTRDTRRSDSRTDSRFNTRSEPRKDTRDTRRSDSRTDSRFNTRSEPRKDTRDTRRSDSRTDSRFNTRSEPRKDTRDGRRSDTKKEFRFSDRSEPRKNSRDSRSEETKKEFQFGSRDNRRSDTRKNTGNRSFKPRGRN